MLSNVRSWGLILLGILLLLGVLMVQGSLSDGSGNSAYAFHGTSTPDQVLDSTDPDHIPTYYGDIAPIIEENCAYCHVDGGIAPFKLETAEDAQENSRDMALSVISGSMPPWMPGEESPPMHGERRLTPEEIGLISAWSINGAPLGEPHEHEDEAPTVAERILREDLVLVPDEPYTPDASLSDDYRCFAVEVDLEEDQYVTGYSVIPGQLSQVHHVVLYQVADNSSIRSQIDARLAEDDRPGWQCYGGPRVSGGGGGLDGALGTWTPGTITTFHPDGTGRHLAAESIVIIQMHYNITDEPLPDLTTTILQFADEDEEIEPLVTYTVFAPVELPCPEDATNEACDRDVAIQQLSERFGSGGGTSDWLLRRCERSLQDYEDQSASNIVSDCDDVMFEGGMVWEVLGHMHTRGKSFRIELNPGTPDAQVLLDIPHWDFNWQGEYQLMEPIEIKPGDVLRTTCVWDNTLVDDPRYIIWGEGTDDEMCIGTVSYVRN